MGTISDAAAGLKARLDTITGLTVYGSPPDAVTKYPAVIIDLGDIEYDPTVNGTDIAGVFNLTVMVKSGNVAAAWAALDGHLDPTGSGSIRAAIMGDQTLGGTVDSCRLEAAVEIDRDGSNPAVVTAGLTLRWYRSG